MNASVNHDHKQHIQLLERRYRAVKGSFEMLTVFEQPNMKGTNAMIEDAQALLDAAEQLHAAMAAMEGEQEQERGIKPLPLDADLLLARITQGGHSGQFLADAFLSAYRTNQPFQHSLGELASLDAEAFRLFHEILHIRNVPGWSDDALYQIEQRIKSIMVGAA